MSQENVNRYGSVAPLRNVAIALETAEKLIKRPAGVDGLGLFYGPSGYGKSRASQYLQNKHNALYLEVFDFWTRKVFVESLLSELGIDRPSGTIAGMMQQALRLLQDDPNRLLIIDEADKLVDKGMIELVRDLYKGARIPVLLVGEEKLPHKLSAYERCQNRVTAFGMAEKCDIEDAVALGRIYHPSIAFQGDLMDTIVDQGTSSMEDIANTLISSLKTLAISNPISNATLGTNLPSIWSLFSDAPSIPGATTTGVMTVNAATVMINGSPLSGLLPGAAPTGGLAGLLGYTPANQNVSAASALGNVLAGTTKTGIPLSSVSANGLTADVNSQYASNFQGFLSELQSRGYNVQSPGGYNYRNIAGTDTLSNHAFGNAIDINPALNPVTRPGEPMVSNLPPDVSTMAAKYGLEWGGDWTSKKDPMHFEVANGAKPLQVDQANAALESLTTTSATTAGGLNALSNSSSQLGSAFGNLLTGTGGAFPPAPASGGFLSSLFGGGVSPFSSTYFPPPPSFAGGTDFAPGGVADVGELGRERVYLPRGSQVVPNHKLADDRTERSSSNVSVHVHNNVGAKVKTRETQDSQGNRRIEVMLDEQVAGSLARSGSATRSTMEEQYNVAPRIKQR